MHTQSKIGSLQSQVESYKRDASAAAAEVENLLATKERREEEMFVKVGASRHMSPSLVCVCLKWLLRRTTVRLLLCRKACRPGGEQHILSSLQLCWT